MRASFLNKTFVLLVCIRMYPYVSRVYPYVSRMYPYVTPMYLYVSVCSVCYPYVLVWCFSHDLKRVSAVITLFRIFRAVGIRLFCKRE